MNFYISECENNAYGAGCLEKCGKCLGGEKCNFVNGICSNGCEAGYYNFSCTAGIIAKKLYKYDKSRKTAYFSNA